MPAAHRGVLRAAYLEYGNRTNVKVLPPSYFYPVTWRPGLSRSGKAAKGSGPAKGAGQPGERPSAAAEASSEARGHGAQAAAEIETARAAGAHAVTFWSHSWGPLPSRRHARGGKSSGARS